MKHFCSGSKPETPVDSLATLSDSCRSMYNGPSTEPHVLGDPLLRLEGEKTRLASVLQISKTGVHTFQGLFSSNPGGAIGLSDCPRKKPVSLRSRSITVETCCVSMSRACSSKNQSRLEISPYFAVRLLAKLWHPERSVAHSIPLV